jgi:glycosyltransferase involved in cell wall biosynthesis
MSDAAGAPGAAVRVLFVTGEYPPAEGGMADYTRCLASSLAARGVTVDVLTHRLQAVVTDEADRRVTVHRALRGWGWGTLIATRRILPTLRPDFVHIQYQTAAYGMHPAVNVLPWWLRRTLTGVTTAVTYHDLRVPYLFPKAGRVRSMVTLLPARWAHLTVATNVADWATLHARGRPWHLALVPIGSNIPDEPPPGYDRAAWRAAHGVAAGEALVAYFGFLNASKGGRGLVDMLARLRSAGHDARLLMIGGRTGASDATNAAYLAQLEVDLARAGLADQVRWTGHVPPAEVSAWLHAADVVALPYADGASYRRGSLLAALAHGRPVVTTHPAALPPAAAADLGPADTPPPLEDGVSARLVPPGDTAALVAAVAALLADPAQAEALATGARALASWFGWPAIAARHVALYGAPR